MSSGNISSRREHGRFVERLEVLRDHIELGVAALDRGEATEIEAGELEGYLATLRTGRRRRPRRKRQQSR